MPASSARALMVGVAVGVGAIFPSALGQERLSPSQLSGSSSDESRYHTIFSFPQREEVSLPRPLSEPVAAQYRDAFRLVREDQYKQAFQRLSAVSDSVLKSDVQAEGYLRVSYQARPQELRAWLQAHSHLPDAPAVQVLETQLSSHTISAETALKPVAPLDVAQAASEEENFAPWGNAGPNARLDRTVQDKASHGVKGAQDALHVIETTQGMRPEYAAYLYGHVALCLLSQGEIEEAAHVGLRGFERGQQKVGFPAYVAGLAFWYQQDFPAAYEHFSEAANAPIIKGDQQAAAAFWAARVAEHTQPTHVYDVWLRRAAVHAESLYGLLAAQRLEQAKHEASPLSGHLSSVGLKGAEAALTHVDLDAVMSMEEGRHFFALLQVGEQGRAEMLARSMWSVALSDPVRARSLQVVVHAAGMWALADQMEHILRNVAPQELQETVEPLPVLKPRHGFKLNPALVYAVARMESNFDGNALSPAGAYGMMQIRPQTAGFIVASYINHDTRNPATVPVPVDMPRRLKDVSYNLELGQLYMKYLASSVARNEGQDTTTEQADLLRVLASYNAGPQAITRWESTQKLSSNDPLYYIETLPNVETRHYVRNVLKTAWLYAHRMRESSPSLKSLSEGKWPSFRREEALRESPS